MCEIGMASRPKPGEQHCGDQYRIIRRANEVVVILADGLGHGPEAALAANTICGVAEEQAEYTPADIIRRCDRQSTHTRGAAVSVVKVDMVYDILVCSGVGNVEIKTLSRKPIHPVSMPGIVGSRVRRVDESSYTLTPGDVIMLASDGISTRLNLEPYRDLNAQDMADALLRDHAKEHDDASCVVIRY